MAEWNNWSNTQKTKKISIKLRGEAQKLLGSLSSDQYNNYETLKTTLSHRFNPQKRESAYSWSSVIAGTRKTKVLVTLASLYGV